MRWKKGNLARAFNLWWHGSDEKSTQAFRAAAAFRYLTLKRAWNSLYDNSNDSRDAKKKAEADEKEAKEKAEKEKPTPNPNVSYQH